MSPSPFSLAKEDLSLTNSSLERGAFIVSIDTELAWGGMHNGQFVRRQTQYQLSRRAIGQLLKLLERFNIQATWAVVGHLFLEECHVTNGVKHPEIMRPRYSWSSGDWFDADPCTNLESAHAWYGSDIVKQILDCKVHQEIGCHTFSHIIVGDPGCSRESIESELRLCCLEAERFGLVLKSFVFPRNSVGHLEMLAKAGFTVFRGPAPNWFGRLPGLASRIGHLVDNLLPISPPVVLPESKNGLWNLPASYYYPPTDRWWGIVPISLRTHKVKRGLRQAVTHRRLMHMWFHEFNLATDTERLLSGLEDIFAEVSRYREAGVLDNPTMGELAHVLQLQK